MRVLVDAIGCDFGGIAIYVENLVRAWPAAFPEDEVHVLRAVGDPELDAPGAIRHAVAVPRPEVLTRPVRQTLAVPALVRDLRVDAVLAVRPVTSLRRLRVPLGVVVHDLRHELLPDQFSRTRRLIRQVSYGRAYQVADGFVCVSQRTCDDLHRLHPGLAGTPSTVVHHGADHVDGWPRTPVEPVALAFGHHTNKNIDLVLDAWRLVVRDAPPTLPRLTIVGLSAEARRDVAAAVERAGLGGHVELAPYLPDPEFRALMAGAATVLLPSDFEGFGLPVVESMRLGIPVVVGPDAAVREISGGHAVAVPALAPAPLADGVRAALARTPEQLSAAREHAAGFTWARTAERTRAFLLRLAATRS